MAPRVWVPRVGLVLIGAVALALRVHGLHRGLIYPDGYDYLLMARGIETHLTPTVRLGPGGVMFIPPVDAALKPLFPGLVALLAGVCGGLRAAADTVTAAAGAATVVLAGLLAGRLTGSKAAALVAAVATLLSPALGYWSGFAGPDPLAEALALAAALALAGDRPKLAGGLAALCAATRPEWLLVFGALGIAGLASPSSRSAARSALITGAFVLAAVVVLLRPPIAVPSGGVGLMLGALAAGTALQLGAAWAARERRRATLVAAGALGVLLAAALSGSAPAARGLLRDEWPMLALAATGLLWACWSGRARAALTLPAAIVLLGAIYAYRNPGSERYLAQLLPLGCVAAGFAATLPSAGSIAHRLPRSVRGVPLIAPVGALAVALAVVITRPLAPVAGDTFAGLAGRLARAPGGALISAAPDAYGYLLPGRAQDPLRVGARGLILLDGAQRFYDPGVRVRGVVIARFGSSIGFERPNGTIDGAPDLLVRGVVAAAG